MLQPKTSINGGYTPHVKQSPQHFGWDPGTMPVVCKRVVITMLSSETASAKDAVIRVNSGHYEFLNTASVDTVACEFCNCVAEVFLLIAGVDLTSLKALPICTHEEVVQIEPDVHVYIKHYIMCLGESVIDLFGGRPSGEKYVSIRLVFLSSLDCSVLLKFSTLRIHCYVSSRLTHSYTDPVWLHGSYLSSLVARAPIDVALQTLNCSWHL